MTRMSDEDARVVELDMTTRIHVRHGGVLQAADTMLTMRPFASDAAHPFLPDEPRVRALVEFLFGDDFDLAEDTWRAMRRQAEAFTEEVAWRYLLLDVERLRARTARLAASLRGAVPPYPRQLPWRLRHGPRPRRYACQRQSGQPPE